MRLEKRRLLLIFSGISLLLLFFSLILYYVFRPDDIKEAAGRLLKDSFDYRQNLAVSREEPVKLSNQPEEGPEKQIPAAVAKQEKKDEPAFDKSYIINIAFLGIDRTEERDEYLGIYRTDTIAVARINLNTRKIGILSIPRDTYAYLPVKDKMDKINHAYAFGSAKGKAVESSLDAINHFLKYAKVDYYFSIDMEPIPEIVDSIGGVKLDVEIDMKTHGADVSKGLQILDGKKAFDYIHWRYAGNGDIDRIKRQQKFAGAMFRQLRDSGGLADTLKLVLKYSSHVKTNMTLKQLLSLVNLANDIPDGSITYYNIEGNNARIKGISYWIPHPEKTEATLKEFLHLD